MSMRSLSRRRLFTCSCIMVVACETAAACIAGEPRDSADVQDLLRELDHDEYPVREAAERRLRNLGPASRQPLTSALDLSSPETRYRICRVLEHLEREQLTGAWRLTRWEANGVATVGEEKGYVIFVKGGEWTMNSTRFSFRLRPWVKPKEIDWMVGKSVFRGIYVLEDDEMVLCLTKESNQPRPKEFKTEKGDGLKLHTRKRISEPAAP